MSRPTPRLLPPRPLRGDWLAAGACAGGLLGVADATGLVLAGVAGPAGLLAGLIATTTLLVALACGLLGVLAARLRPLTSHSEMAGAVTGPMVLAAGLGPSLAAWHATPWAGLASLALTLAAALAIGGVAARAAGRLERQGTPPSGIWIWAALAVLIVAANGSAGRAWLGLLAAVAVGAGLAALAVELGRQRPTGGFSWRRRLLWVGLVAVALSTGERVLPWLLIQGRLDAPGPASPSLLVVVWPGRVDPAAESDWESPTLAVLAREGTVGESRDPEVWRKLRGGGDLLGALAVRGYVSAAAVTRLEAAGAAEPLWRPGVGGLLEGPARRSVAGSLLAASGARAVGPVRLDRALRSPEDLTRAARGFLLRWWGTRAPAPFALLVDYRAGDEPPPMAALDRALADLLSPVEQLGLIDRTALLVVLDPGPAGAGAPARLVYRAPAGRPGAPARGRSTAWPSKLLALAGPPADAPRGVALP